MKLKGIKEPITHTHTCRQDTLWSFAVLIGRSAADVIIVEQTAT